MNFSILSLHEHGSVIKNAIVNTIVNHNIKTADMGGIATTTEFMKYVIEEIKSLTPEIGQCFFLILYHIRIYLLCV